MKGESRQPQIIFLCAGGLFTPVLPVDPDGRFREPDRIHYFSAEQVANETGLPEAAIHEGYAVFLQEFGSGLAGADRAATARAILRWRFRHLRDEHFEELLHFCRVRQINPWGNQVRARVRDGQLRVRFTVQGLYAQVIQSGQLARMIGPEWCGPDGRWVEVWTGEQPPAAARVGVQRHGMGEPLFAIAGWRDRNEPKRHKRHAFVLGRRATCQAIRVAFADWLDAAFSEPSPPAAPGEPLNFQKIDVEDLPAISRQFHLRLINFGYQDPERRAELIEQYRRRYPILYARNVAAFYREVIGSLERNDPQERCLTLAAGPE